jgi:hypothetical protein
MGYGDYMRSQLGPRDVPIGTGAESGDCGLVPGTCMRADHVLVCLMSPDTRAY